MLHDELDAVSKKLKSKQDRYLVMAAEGKAIIFY